jgi:hypothetical protein
VTGRCRRRRTPVDTRFPPGWCPARTAGPRRTGRSRRGYRARSARLASRTCSPQPARPPRGDSLAAACRVKPGDGKYGENLWAGTAGSYTPRKVVDSWYAESRAYNFKRPGYSSRTARFTQLVWLSSRHYGCATAQCKKTQFWVCLYDPPGNKDGEFEKNVLPKSECPDE